MFITHLLTLLLGIIGGILLLTLTLIYLFQVKCPQCKQLRPLREVIHWSWKTKTITGQPCLQCQRPKPQINL